MPFMHRLLKALRALHLYLGVFTAPALLFFAFSGALQTLDLHEAARGSAYRPPMWLQSLAHLHKKQSLEVPVRRASPSGVAIGTDPAARAAPADAGVEPRVRTAPPAPRRHLLPMKLYFVLVSGNLILSTLTGVYMAARFARHRGWIVTALVAGLVVPALLLIV